MRLRSPELLRDEGEYAGLPRHINQKDFFAAAHDARLMDAGPLAVPWLELDDVCGPQGLKSLVECIYVQEHL